MCERVEPTKQTHGGCAPGSTRSAGKGEPGGTAIQVTHRAGRHTDGAREVKGEAEPPKTPVTLCAFPPASPEVPVQPEPLKAGKWTYSGQRSGDVCEGQRYRGAVWSPYSQTRSHESTAKVWLLKSCLGRLIKRPEGNLDGPGPLPIHTQM